MCVGTSLSTFPTCRQCRGAGWSGIFGRLCVVFSGAGGQEFSLGTSVFISFFIGDRFHSFMNTDCDYL